MEIDWARGDVIQVDGRDVAHATRAWLRERAEVQIGTHLWDFRSNGWGGTELTASLDGTTHFGARRSGFFTSTCTIDIGTDLELKQAGWFTSSLALSRGGAQIGEVTRSGLFTSRPRLVLSEPLDTAAGVFVLWIAYVELSRRANSSSGGSAGATG